MNIENIHPEIKSFIGNCCEENCRIHTIGVVKVFSFDNPKVRVFFIKEEESIKCLIRYDEKMYSEDDFLRMLRLKIFW